MKTTRNIGINWFNTIPFITILLTVSLIFLPNIFQGKVLFWGTASTQFIPWLKSAWESVTRGVFPFWNPYNGMGAPLIANYQSAFFYPPIWITYPFYLLGSVAGLATGISVLVYLHVIWAGFGMVLLVRKLGMNPLSQLISGLSFSLGGFLIARVNFLSMIWAISWIPWIVLECTNVDILRKQTGNEIKVKKSIVWLGSIGLIAVIALQLLCGHAQITWYTLIFSFFWIGFLGWQHEKIKGVVQNLFVLIGCGLVAALLSAVQLIPTTEYLIQSQRASSVAFAIAMNYSFWPPHLANMLSPDFFGNPRLGDYWGFGAYWEDAIYFGIIPFILSFTTVKNWSQKTNRNNAIIRFLWLGFLVSIVLALGNNLPIFPFLFRNIPTFDLFQAPTRFMIIGIFCLTLLSGFGTEKWFIPTGRKLYLFRLGAMGAVAILLGSFLGFLYLRGDLQTLVRGMASFGIGLFVFCIISINFYSSKINRKNRIFWSFAVLGVLMVDLISATRNIIPWADSAIFSQINEIAIDKLRKDRIYMDSSTETTLKYRRFFRFDDFRSLENWQDMFLITLPNTNLLSNQKMVNNFDPFVPNRFAKWVELVETATGKQKQEMLNLMDVGFLEILDLDSNTGVSFQTIKNSNSIWWFTCVSFSKNLESSENIIQHLLSDSNDSILARILIELPERAGAEDCFNNSNLIINKIISVPGKKILNINASDKGWLLNSETFYPGWKAFIDGKEASLLPAMLVFQGVEIPAGDHQVIFLYQPYSCYYGAVISISSLIIIFLVFGIKIFVFRKHSNE